MQKSTTFQIWPTASKAAATHAFPLCSPCSLSPLSSTEIKFETEQASRPMLKPGANLEMLSADEEEEETAPKLQLLDDQQESSIESSRSVTPDV